MFVLGFGFGFWLGVELGYGLGFKRVWALDLKLEFALGFCKTV